MPKNQHNEVPHDHDTDKPIVQDAFHHGMDLIHQAEERTAEEGYDAVGGVGFLDSTDLSHVELSQYDALPDGPGHQARRTVGNTGLRLI